jgi:hypothetical protein
VELSVGGYPHTHAALGFSKDGYRIDCWKGPWERCYELTEIEARHQAEMARAILDLVKPSGKQVKCDSSCAHNRSIEGDTHNG